MENNNNNNQETENTGASESLNGVAGWVISAFFSSLERFSCVNISTFDPDDDEEGYENDSSPIASSRDSSNLPV